MLQLQIYHKKRHLVTFPCMYSWTYVSITRFLFLVVNEKDSNNRKDLTGLVFEFVAVGLGKVLIQGYPVIHVKLAPGI